ncbi:MAG: hypothetical protein JNK38_14575 [Acidobacteria bacterium]|nr:hypothetical protein [Acidobacteriota bacterium]
MQKQLDAFSEKLSSVRQEADGSLSADCPVCSMDGKGAGKLKVFADGSLVCHRFSGSGEHSAHRKNILKALGINNLQHTPAFISESLFDGTLTLEVSPADRGRVRLIARNCVGTLHRDLLNLDKADERERFVKRLELDDEKQGSAHQALRSLADRFDSVQAAIEDEESEESETKQAIFADLTDGRLAEQIAGGLYAVYDTAKGEVTYHRKIQDDLNSYEPLQDDFVLKGGLFLPERLIEYGDEASLDAEIESCINRYSDVPKRELKLSTKYVRLSYIADKLNELSYLRATGERGSGKSRYISTVGMLCLRPIAVSSPSAASLFRMMDAYQPTLILDECNLAVGNEDTDMLIQILNSGFQRIAQIPRIEKGADGQMTIKLFSPFGPKLIGGLKLSDSGAFESRCVQVELQKTLRKDISFRLTARMLQNFADLRAKLYLWRLRNWHKDYEQAFDDAERELKNYSIEPRFIQIAIPVYGLITDASLKDDFARMLEGRTDDATSDKQESFDGQLAAIVHRLLFEVKDDETVVWKDFGNYPPPEEGIPLELASIEQITATINDGLSEKKRHSDNWISRELGKLGFKRKLVKRRASIHYQKSAVIFARDTFAKVFGNYFLPLPADFISRISRNEAKPNADNEMRCERYFSNSSQSEIYLSQVKSLPDSELGRVREMREISFQEEAENNSPGAYLSQSDAVLALVSLDTETEPFDKKRGVTSRNARMIGLALSYDGGGQTSYTPDCEAWPLLMPEPEQTVVMHNAKFDLAVLERSGLPLPATWEDTMIAAHLLDENGEHGLKPLAKEHLGIDDPVTFEEADRARLLDPEIFHEYARNDARYTWRLWRKFQPELDRQGLLQVYKLEKQVVPAVMAMETAGMKLDLDRMAEMNAVVQAEAETIKAEIYESAGCRFDLHSPQKVAAILFDKLGVPSRKETKGGQRSVDREALEDVRGHHPAVDAVLRYREIDKLASTFLTTLPKFADERGRIHPEFRPLGTTSGRFSCSNPSVQQIPARSELGKKLRQMFIADEGNALVVADWSQMELRILAEYSKDPLLIEAYCGERETDLHTLTAARMFGKAEADVTKPERSIAKMINFGIAYGITPVGLFNRLRPQGVDVTEAQCEQFVADYFRTYPGVRKFLNQVESRSRQRGYVHNRFGRRRRVSGQTSREVRQAQNFIIQATAADMAKMAMVRLHAALPEGARLIAMVHDEFIVECPAAQAEVVRDLMTEVMQAAPTGFTVPMVVEATIAANWGEAK